MRQLIPGTAVVVISLIALAGFTPQAQAHDPFYSPYFSHRQFHNDLIFREYQRQLLHWQAHQYPMTWWEHRQLHNSLNYDRYLDHRAHQLYHYYNGYPYCTRPGITLYFGR